MKKLFLNNYRIKLISVFIAVSMWWFVYLDHSPQYRMDVTAPVKYEGLDKSLRKISGPDTVRLRVYGNPGQLDLARERKIRIKANLKGLSEGEHRISGQVDNKTGARVVERAVFLNITLKKLNRMEMPVSFKFYGALPPGLKLGQRGKLMRVDVYGDEKDLARVSRIIAGIDLTDRVKNFSVKVPLRAVNSAGAVIQNIKIDPEEVAAEIPIEKESSAVVPVVIMLKGGSKGDIDKIDYTPARVSLFGDQGLIGKVSSVTTEEFDYELCRKGGFFSLKIVYPPDVTGSAERVSVYCEPPEKISRSFAVNVKVINLCRDCFCDGCENVSGPVGVDIILPSSVDVTASGAGKQINSLNISDISSVADMLGLEPGSHKVKVHVSLTTPEEGVELRQEPAEMEITVTGKK